MGPNRVNTRAGRSVSLGVTASRPTFMRLVRTLGFSVAALVTAAVLEPGPALGASAEQGSQVAPPVTSSPPNGRSSNSGRQSGQSSPWWNDLEIKRDLGLTDDQSKKFRDIFQKREADIQPVLDRLNREASRLDKMTRERVADETAYAVQVQTVENLLARLRESRTMMIYRMYRELQPEQHRKLEEIMARRRSTDSRGRESGPR